MSVPQASLHSLLYSHSMPSSQPLRLESDNLTAGSALVAQHLRPQIRERSQKHRTHLHFLTRVRFISPILRTATCAWFPTSLLPPVCACAGVSLSGPKSLGRRGWQPRTHAKVGEARGYGMELAILRALILRAHQHLFLLPVLREQPCYCLRWNPFGDYQIGR
jgi:hypothetical protein